MNNVWVFFLSTVALCFAIHSSTSPSTELHPSYSGWRGCDKGELRQSRYTISHCSDCTTDSVYVPHESHCEVFGKETNKTFGKLCHNGQWINIESELHNRKKRYLGGNAAFREAFCPYWCDEETGRPKFPPRFTKNCPPDDLHGVYVAPFSAEGATVSWKVPFATDLDGSLQSVKQVFGTSNGGTFEGSPTGQQHSIIYEATDNDCLTATCYFSFIVKVETCHALPWPENGYSHCPHDPRIGQSCTYCCNAGYQLVPNVDTVTCKNMETGPDWTTVPACKKLTCGSPPEVENGQMICIDPAHSFSSHCTVSCSTGFKINGPMFVKCEADGSWYGLNLTTCLDDTQPELHCKTPQVFYAERQSAFASVIWEEPTATDNHDPNPNVAKTSGPDQGTTIEAGTSIFVKYRSTDSAGNQSPSCTMELRVQEITCGHPLETLEDTKLLFNCSMSTYTYGDICKLSCYRKLPLEGSDLITCEVNNTMPGEPQGYWNWKSDKNPFCKDIACPDLEPPKHGALVHDSINDRPITTMLCNKQFDIPDVGTRFNGIFFCQDSGNWLPNVAKAPDCIEPFNSRIFRLPSTLFYYDGTCGEDDNIHSQFEAIIRDMNTNFQELCPPIVTCTAVNPRITCGETQRRKRSMGQHGYLLQAKDRAHMVKKRQTDNHVLTLSFDIETDLTEFNNTGMSTLETLAYVENIQLHNLTRTVQNAIGEGRLNISSWSLHEDSFQTAPSSDWYCNPGSSRSGNTNICKPCSPGYYEQSGVCTDCPIGEYSNTTGAVTCTKCTDGYSTRNNASEYADNCIELCEPGAYSPDTFAPCAQCKVGFYQAQSGQTRCNACPTGKSTTRTGSKTVTDCQYFDALLSATDGQAWIADITLPKDISVMFWVKSTLSEKTNTVMKFGDKFDVVFADTINVTLKNVSYHIGPSSEAWSHVSVTWDTSNNVMSAYYKGIKVHQRLIRSTRSLLALNDVLTVEGTGITITGFSVRGDVINDTDVIHYTESCHTTTYSDVFNMDNFKNSVQQGISLTTPSECYVIDGCEGSPCGIHKCKNENDGFTCTCFNGWSGPTCSTPPDFCIGNACTNNATCVNIPEDYTMLCQCLPGYGGLFCENPPVDGKWSEWSAWSDCSSSCNIGTQQRKRACDSPPSGEYGRSCAGQVSDYRECHNTKCQECPELNRAFGNMLSCLTSTSGFKSCTITCTAGYILPKEIATNIYTCGRDTNYVWQPFETAPDCIKPNRPERYQIAVSVAYNTVIPLSHQQAVKNAVVANVFNTSCSQAIACEVHVNISNTVRKRRSTHSTGSEIILSFVTTLNNASGLADLQDNGTVSTGLQEIINATHILKSTASAINSSASSVFDVTVHGTSYTVNNNTLKVDGSASCPNNQVVQDGLCVNVSSDGDVSSTAGPVVSKCTPISPSKPSYVTDTTNPTPPSVYSEASSDPDNTAVYVGVFVPVSVITTVGVVVVIWWTRRKQTKTRRRPLDRRSHMSMGQQLPTNQNLYDRNGYDSYSAETVYTQRCTTQPDFEREIPPLKCTLIDCVKNRNEFLNETPA